MTVLDGLHYIKENLDQTLAWRYSCRMGVCGSCGMLINGVPALACNTQILEVAGTGSALGPLPNFDIVRDLVPDLTAMFEKHRALTPFISRDEAEINDPAGEYYQSPEDLERYLQFSFCIKCGCCMSACPTLATDTRYLGPMPLTQAFRYNNDTRDGAAGRASRRPGRHAPRRLPLPLRRRVLARLPQGRRPGKSNPAPQAPAGGGLSRPRRAEPKPCAKQAPASGKRRPASPSLLPTPSTHSRRRLLTSPRARGILA